MTDFLNRTVDKLRESPVGPVVKILENYPRLSAWVVLSVGMLILLVIEARAVGSDSMELIESLSRLFEKKFGEGK